MRLQQRIELLFRLRNYISGGDESLQVAKNQAYLKNNWFIPAFIDISVQNIADGYLQEEDLLAWVKKYDIPAENYAPKRVGIVMAGNIPLVGFHDLLCVFLTGNIAAIKLSGKDEVLIRHFIEKMIEWNPAAAPYFEFHEILKNCDAYIATGSNNSARYFEHYFQKYPHIIRKNRTSVAILTGDETAEELAALADDVFLYFGMGCRNVTKIYVPKGYAFEPLLEVFKKYNWMEEHHKYKNNYDYQLAVLILGKQYYMSTPALVLHENQQLFSPVSQLNYEFYENGTTEIVNSLIEKKDELQCIVGREYISFGTAQQPKPDQYADGVDTLTFLLKLTSTDK
ncbi:acyl-CoA reductase [Gynurincola endophyticus]|uniref:acyl-CoA reductase n=1 Tax=Gynurincola endophyticus TaxID=2479004 RepID=UPI000F8CB9A3|nr:acyl-CoA reductase [Gynurincola endophyticus]